MHLQPACDPILALSGCDRALALIFAERANVACQLCGEGKPELTESVKKFQKFQATGAGAACSGGADVIGSVIPDLFLLRLQHLFALFEDPVDGL